LRRPPLRGGANCEDAVCLGPDRSGAVLLVRDRPGGDMKIPTVPKVQWPTRACLSRPVWMLEIGDLGSVSYLPVPGTTSARTC